MKCIFVSFFSREQKMSDGRDALFDDAAVPGPGTVLSARGPFGAFPEALPHAGEELERTCESSDGGEEQIAEISPLAVLDPAKLRQVQAQRFRSCDSPVTDLPAVAVPFELEAVHAHHDDGHDAVVAPHVFDHQSSAVVAQHTNSSNDGDCDDNDSEGDSGSTSRTSCDAIELEDMHGRGGEEETPQTMYAPPPALPKLTMCLRCLTRLEDMERSPGFGCKKGARLFKQNWVESHKKCFGACQCDDFCVSHGFPVDQCIWMHPGAAHKVTRYYGHWGDASTKNMNPRMHNGNLVPPAWAVNQDTFAQQQQAPSAPFPGQPSQKRCRNGDYTVAPPSTTIAAGGGTAAGTGAMAQETELFPRTTTAVDTTTNGTDSVPATTAATTTTTASSFSSSSVSSPSPLPPPPPLPLALQGACAPPPQTPVQGRRERTGGGGRVQRRLEGQSAYLVPCAEIGRAHV